MSIFNLIMWGEWNCFNAEFYEIVFNLLPLNIKMLIINDYLMILYQELKVMTQSFLRNAINIEMAENLEFCHIERNQNFFYDGVLASQYHTWIRRLVKLGMKISVLAVSNWENTLKIVEYKTF